MSFQIEALPRNRFAHLFGLTDEALKAHGAMRRVADRSPGFPCRVSLEDAAAGEPVLLVNFAHLPTTTPYRSSYAIYVREDAVEARPAINEVPAVLARRLLSVRAFDAAGMLQAANVVEGSKLASALEELVAPDDIAFVHIHNAKPGCYAARAVRVE